MVHFKDVNCYLRMSKSNREGIMGIFGDIMSKIFGQSAKAETPQPAPRRLQRQQRRKRRQLRQAL